MARRPRRPPQAKNTLDILRGLSRETADVFSDLTPAFTDLAARPSDILLGFVGFGGGISSAFLLHVAVPAAEIGYGAFAFSVLCAPLAMLLGRGVTYFRLERRIKAFDLLLTSSRKRVDSLKDGPPEAYEAAFRNYQRLVQRLDDELIKIATGGRLEALKYDQRPQLTDQSGREPLLNTAHPEQIELEAER